MSEKVAGRGLTCIHIELAVKKVLKTIFSELNESGKQRVTKSNKMIMIVYNSKAEVLNSKSFNDFAFRVIMNVFTYIFCEQNIFLHIYFSVHYKLTLNVYFVL